MTKQQLQTQIHDLRRELVALRIDLALVAEVLDYEFFVTEEQPAKRGIRIKDDG